MLLKLKPETQKPEPIYNSELAIAESKQREKPINCVLLLVACPLAKAVRKISYSPNWTPEHVAGVGTDTISSQFSIDTEPGSTHVNKLIIFQTFILHLQRGKIIFSW